MSLVGGFRGHDLRSLTLYSKGRRYVGAVYPEHPFAGKNGLVPFHRLVMENHLGRYLDKLELVHHIDGDKHNNKLDNLMLVDASTHAELHRKLPPVRRCLACGRKFKVTTRIGPKYSTRRYCSEKCRLMGRRLALKVKEAQVVERARRSRCLLCGKKVKKQNSTYCSSACQHFATRRAERPTPKELKKLVWAMPTEQLARKLGVSGSAIAKWCKEAGVKKPPRGYWTKIRPT